MEDKYISPQVKESEKFYKRSLWWISHREGIRKLGLGTRIFIDAILILFAVWVVVDTFLFSYEAERGLLRSLVVENRTDLHQSSVTQSARPLRIERDPVVLGSAEDKVDFLATVTNPNSDWWVEYSYKFIYGAGEETVQQVDFLYPEETRSIVLLAHDAPRYVTAKIESVDTRWHRMDTKAIRDLDTSKAERIDFDVINSEYKTVQIDDETIGRSSFTITNKAAFAYWNVPLTVLLKRGASVAAVTTTVLEQIDTGESKTISINWFQILPNITEIEVVPVVNIFDPTVFMDLGSEAALDTRVQVGQ